LNYSTRTYISARIRLDEENIIPARTEGICKNRQYVSTVGCLLNGISKIIICSSVSFSPDYVSARISLDEEKITNARTEGPCPTRHYVSTV
jgi:hypothetical protein